MKIEQELLIRSDSKCELCGAAEGLAVYEVPPESNGSSDECILVCASCSEQVVFPWSLVYIPPSKPSCLQAS